MSNKKNNLRNEEELSKKLNANLKQLDFIDKLESYLGDNRKLTKKVFIELEQIKLLTKLNTLDSLSKLKKPD